MRTSEPAAEKTFDMSPTELAGPYQPLVFRAEPPSNGRTNRLVGALLNQYGGKRLPWQQWRGHPPFRVTWEENVRESAGPRAVRRSSSELSFGTLANYLRKHRSLDEKALGLPPLNKNWMDTSIVMAMNFHAPCDQDDSHLTIQLPQGFDATFAVTPSLDREGIAFPNVQLHLQQQIVRLRTRLVTRSETLFDNGDGQWLQDLMGYLNTAVSLVDATLSRFYQKAKHEWKTLGWSFDRSENGSEREGNFRSRIARIKAITRKEVKGADSDLSAFEHLKEVRNHLHHFDPPAFVMSIEDAAAWLNAMDCVASLLWRIRETLDLPPSVPLIEMLLAPQVAFVPRHPRKRRAMQTSTVGYASCRRETPQEK